MACALQASHNQFTLHLRNMPCLLKAPILGQHLLPRSVVHLKDTFLMVPPMTPPGSLMGPSMGWPTRTIAIRVTHLLVTIVWPLTYQSRPLKPRPPPQLSLVSTLLTHLSARMGYLPTTLSIAPSLLCANLRTPAKNLLWHHPLSYESSLGATRILSPN